MKDLDILKIGARAVTYEFSKKVQLVYDLLDHKWVFENGEYDVPDNEQIYAMLMNLINKLDDESDIMSCGGLVVEKEYEEDSLVGLNLKMEITSEVYLDELKGEI